MKRIPILSFIDGKLVYSRDDLYPVICDGKIITSIRLSEIDASNKDGGPGVPPTESIKEAGYLGGSEVKPYGLENHTDILRQGCALVNNWIGIQGILVNDEAVELVKIDENVSQNAAKLTFELLKDCISQIPDTLLVSKPLILG